MQATLLVDLTFIRAKIALFFYKLLELSMENNTVYSEYTQSHMPNMGLISLSIKSLPTQAHTYTHRLNPAWLHWKEKVVHSNDI